MLHFSDHIQYKIDEKIITLKIYLENAPYYKEPLEQAGYENQKFCELNWYVTPYDDYQTIISFDNNYVYAITADSIDTIKILMEGN